MSQTNDKINRRQLIGMCFACVLSSLIHRIPGRVTEIAGSGAWLSVLIAAAPVSLLFAFVLSQLRGSNSGKGLGQVIIDSFGNYVGKAILTLYTLWFIAVAAFTLRSGAERFMTTIYPGSTAPVFILTMLAACLPAALGRLKALARSSMLFRPVLLGTLLMVLLFALPDVDLTGIWQPAPGQELPILRAALDTVSPMSICVYLAFISDQSERGLKFYQFSTWFVLALALAELMTVTTVGILGVELTAKIHNPFFAMVRDITIFGTIEHVEAVLVTIWVFSDFVMVSLFLFMAAKNLRILFSIPEAAEKAKPFDMSHGRYLVLLCAAAAGCAAIFVAPQSVDMGIYTNVIIPAANLFMAYFLIPLTFLFYRLRRKA